MGELLLMELGGGRYAMRREEIISLSVARSVQRLPFASSSIAALCSVGERTLTLADLSACLGLPAVGQGGQALVLSESERVAGFLAGGELAVLASSQADVRPLPASISTPVVDTCVFLDSRPVPVINLRALYRLALAGEPAPAIAWRAPSGSRAVGAARPRLRRVRVAGTLFAVSGPEGFGNAADARGLCPLPRAPAHVAGVAALGGAPVPVVDLACCAGLSAPGPAAAIVEARLGSLPFGLLVDEDRGDWNDSGIRVRALPPLLATPWMRSAALLAGEMVPILELEEILSAGGAAGKSRAEPVYHPGSAFPALFGRQDSDVVEFSLLGATHALPKCEVTETAAWEPSHRVPLAPPMAAGALEHAGEILPVIDLAAAFGMVSSPSPRWRMLLVTNGDFRGLVLSEAVLGGRRLDSKAQQELPIELPFPVVYGCYTDGNSVRLILNVEELVLHFDPTLAHRLHPAFSLGQAEAPVEAATLEQRAPAQTPPAAVEAPPEPAVETAPAPAEEILQLVPRPPAEEAPLVAAPAEPVVPEAEPVAQAEQVAAAVETAEALEGEPAAVAPPTALPEAAPIAAGEALHAAPSAGPGVETLPAAELPGTPSLEELPVEPPLEEPVMVGTQPAGPWDETPRLADEVALSLPAEQAFPPEGAWAPSAEAPSPPAGIPGPPSAVPEATIGGSLGGVPHEQVREDGSREGKALAAGGVLCSLAVLVTILVIMAVPRFVPGAGRPAEKPVAGLAATAPAAERPGGTVAQTQTRREPQLELSLPAGSPVEASEYVVREGDTLWSIARRFTGNPFNYPRIAGENRIADPDLIFPGQRIRLTREKAPAAGADR